MDAGVMERIESKYEPEPMSGCWLWTAATWRGYGAISFGGRDRRAHVVMYELLVGPVPPGLQLDHLCRVRSCVNPAHLQPVTNRENALRGISFSARNAAKKACVRGHPFDAVNTRVLPSGWRSCKACNRKYKRVPRPAIPPTPSPRGASDE